MFVRSTYTVSDMTRGPITGIAVLESVHSPYPTNMEKIGAESQTTGTIYALQMVARLSLLLLDPLPRLPPDPALRRHRPMHTVDRRRVVPRGRYNTLAVHRATAPQP